MKDMNEVMRGACNACDCTEFSIVKGSFKCEDCGCKANKHREENYGNFNHY